mgnify:CR=1 FL=1
MTPSEYKMTSSLVYDTAYDAAVKAGWTKEAIASLERAWAGLTPTERGERIAEAAQLRDRAFEESASAEKAYEDLFFGDEEVEETVQADAWALQKSTWAEYLELALEAEVLEGRTSRDGGPPPYARLRTECG